MFIVIALSTIATAIVVALSVKGNSYCLKEYKKECNQEQNQKHVTKEDEE